MSKLPVQHGSGAARRRHPDKEPASRNRRVPRRNFRVCYLITREEYYEVRAPDAAEALRSGFFGGEFIESGETTSVVDCQAEELPRSERRRHKRLRRWNYPRARWARAAIDTFIRAVRTDECDALCDLLCDLMHLADREGWNFASEYRRAVYHYTAEQSEP